MNYGKFFRLNQRASKIEDGIAIYDYIDLPAYFDSSKNNEMSSPKYPINVTITESSICFRVHYSVYKSEALNDYIYEAKRAYGGELTAGSSSTAIKHMEEVILELPYINSDSELYNAIKDVYNTKYPFVNKGTTFIQELIKKRYEKKSSGEKTLYDKMRENLDGDLSYSTLWLMDISRRIDEKTTRIELLENGIVVKFLRKLLLDFMYDLKHSDVFQTSKFYSAMMSGLMSNFYFSALMHKCEYYFYRSMIGEIIKRKNEKEKEKRIKELYAENLYEAETLWIQDIMNPASEKYFEHYYIKEENQKQKENKSGLCKIICNFYNRFFATDSLSFRNWNSWFASPEEEMRRVSFSMTERESRETHICNVETVFEYLKNEDKGVDEITYKGANANKTEISQWFMKRYSFNDVAHLHIFKNFSRLFFTIVSIMLLLVFIFPDFTSVDFWTINNCNLPIACVIVTFCGCVIWALSIYNEYTEQGIEDNAKSLKNVRIRLIKKRIRTTFLTLFIGFTIIVASDYLVSMFPQMEEDSPVITFLNMGAIFVQVLLISLVGYFLHKKMYPVHWLSNMHIFFPRLIASIATAWLTIAIGNELFGTFFDSVVSWSTSLWLSVIVFVFLMYEINRKLPYEKVFNKAIRCSQMMLIGYAISFVVGLFIINFTGERFLERSGVLDTFYKEYVDKDNAEQQVGHQNYKIVNNGENTSKLKTDAKRLENLKNVHIVSSTYKKGGKTPNHPIVTSAGFNGKYFIMRDFLIQFAFVAMFIGIFIQMLFEERSITEI